MAPLGWRRLTWFLVAALAVAGVTVALVLTLSGSNSPTPVRAIPASAVASPAPSAGSQAIPPRSRFEHGVPSLNPPAERRTPLHSGVSKAAPKAQHYAPNIALRKEGLVRRTGR
jgi:hypothetical protein